MALPLPQVRSTVRPLRRPGLPLCIPHLPFDFPYAALRHVVNVSLDELQERAAVLRGLPEHLDLVGRDALDELLRLPAVLHQGL